MLEITRLDLAKRCIFRLPLMGKRRVPFPESGSGLRIEIPRESLEDPLVFRSPRSVGIRYRPRSLASVFLQVNLLLFRPESPPDSTPLKIRLGLACRRE